MFRIVYHRGDGRIQYRNGHKLTNNAENADQLTFEDAFEIVTANRRDALRVFQTVMLMEECDDSSEAPGPGVQDRSVQAKGAAKKKVRHEERKMAVEKRKRSTVEKDPLLLNYNRFGSQTFRAVKIRPDYLTDEIILTRIDLMRRVHTNELGLEEAFPSPPFRNPKYNIRHETEDGKYSITTWMTLYACKHAVALLMRGEGYSWKNTKTIVTDSGRIIRSDHLEEIMEYDLSEKEKQFIMPEPVMSHLSGNPLKLPENLSVPKKMERYPAASSEGDRRSSRERAVINRAAQKPTGDVTPQTIANTLSVTPSQVRSAMRKLKIEKPYSWDKTTGGEITAQVAKALGKKK